MNAFWATQPITSFHWGLILLNIFILSAVININHETAISLRDKIALGSFKQSTVIVLKQTKMAGYHFKQENDQDVSFIATKVREAWLTDCMEGCLSYF